MEDVRRDTRGVLGPAWQDFVMRRFAEMHLTPTTTEGALCGWRGEGAETSFVAAEPRGVDEATGIAVLIALAKAVDTSEAPGAWRFCVGTAPGIVLGPFGPGALDPDAPRAGTPMPSRRLEQIDYRELANQARGVWARYAPPGCL